MAHLEVLLTHAHLELEHEDHGAFGGTAQHGVETSHSGHDDDTAEHDQDPHDLTLVTVRTHYHQLVHASYQRTEAGEQGEEGQQDEGQADDLVTPAGRRRLRVVHRGHVDDIRVKVEGVQGSLKRVSRGEPEL